MDVDIEGGIETDNGIVNATVVYGRFPNLNKRQQSPLATFYSDSNGGGLTWTAMYPYLEYGGGVAANMMDKISSIDMLDMNYILYVYTDFNYGGNCWSFRSPIRIYNLADYGINDAILSVRFVYVGLDYGAIVLYQDSNYKGKSMYVPAAPSGTTNYPDIRTTGSISGMCGNFGNDKLSSFMIFKWTYVTFYKDTDLQGPNYGYSAAGAYDYTASLPNANDQISSLSLIRYA